MGVWGTKIGESDSALDLIYEITIDGKNCIEKCFLESEKYIDEEKVICAIALVDLSISGFDKMIWRKSLFNNSDMLFIEQQPLWGLLDKAIEFLPFFIKNQKHWNTPELEQERQDILLRLYIKLKNAKELKEHSLWKQKTNSN